MGTEADDKMIQYIVVNKALRMSPGKMAAQVSHASMAFLARMVQDGVWVNALGERMHAEAPDGSDAYRSSVVIPADVYDEWLGGIFTKAILEVKSEQRLLRVISDAEASGLVEGRDFFPIRDACLTELEPDETGTRLTCVGFRPMRRSELAPVVGKLQLYRG